MKLPDASKLEATLARRLTPEARTSLVYAEKAVLMDEHMQPRDYFVFALLSDRLLVLDAKKPTRADDEAPTAAAAARPSPRGAAVEVALLDVVAVELLADPASFLPDDVAADSQHVALRLRAAAASGDEQVPALHLFTFYEDSRLYHMLLHTWQHARRRRDLAALYGADSPAEDASLLSEGAQDALCEDLISELVRSPDATDVSWKSDALDELAVLCARSRVAQRRCLDSPELLAICAQELRRLACLAPYLSQDFLVVISELSTEDVRADLALAELLLSLLNFFCRLVAGSEALPERMRLLGSASLPFDELLGALNLWRAAEAEDGARGSADSLLRSSPGIARLQSLQREVARAPDAAQVAAADEAFYRRGAVNTRARRWHSQGQRRTNEAEALQRAVAEIEMLHAELLLHIFALLEHARLLARSRSAAAEAEVGAAPQAVEALFQHLLARDSFKRARLPRLAARALALVDGPASATAGHALYCALSLLSRVVSRSSEALALLLASEPGAALRRRLARGEVAAVAEKNTRTGLFYRTAAAAAAQLRALLERP